MRVRRTGASLSDANGGLDGRLGLAQAAAQPQRPRVILRWGNASELLVSGLLDGGDEIAQHAAVIDSPLERGHVILFSNNPFWRGQTAGSYSLVWNVLVNFDNLNAGRKLDEK